MVKTIGYTNVDVTPNAELCFIIRTSQFRFADGRLRIVFATEFWTLSIFSGQKSTMFRKLSLPSISGGMR